MIKTLRIGTRGSPLALHQANELRDQLVKHLKGDLPPHAIEIVPIRTSGDWRPEHKESRFLDKDGDKGLFTKEIDEALLNGFIDLAVHSLKDVPSKLPDHLEIAALLERADPRDAFLSRHSKNLQDMPPGSSIGTASLRRQAQILEQRPDLRVTPLRGNVETRIRKMDTGDVDAIVLAYAGLQRLGIESRMSSLLETNVMLPAAGQGAIAIEIRSDQDQMRQLVAAINHQPTATCVASERAFLLAIGGSCHSPLGALAALQEDGSLKLNVLAARADGTDIIRLERQGAANAAEKIGDEAGHSMKELLPIGFFVTQES